MANSKPDRTDVFVRLDTKTFAKVKAAADRDGRSVSAWIRVLIERATSKK